MTSKQDNQHWAKQQERGNRFFLNLTRLIVQYAPLSVIRFITFWVVCYFFATSKNARKNILTYQNNLRKSYPDKKLPAFAVFRQFLAFGDSIIDRFAVWQHQIRYKDILMDDEDGIYPEICSGHGRGQILVCSHLGNIEICRVFVNDEQHAKFRLNSLVHNRHAEIFNQTLNKTGINKLSVIQVEDLDAQKMLELHERLERGEWIAIAADRIPVRGDKMAKINFLGQEADFPQGAWFLAALLKAPINTVFCLKEQGRYRLKLRRFCPPITGRSKVREENIRQAMQQYADCLAKECKENPLLWFNFYDFWKKSE